MWIEQNTQNTLADTGQVRAAQRGDLKAFNRLVLAHQDGLYNLACRVLGDETAAAEAVRQAFLWTYRELKEIRTSGWRSLLYRCAVRACRQFEARSAARNGAKKAGYVPPFAGQPELNLAVLPLDLRLVVALIDLEGLDYGEAAEALEISFSEVRARLSEGRCLLAGQCVNV